MNETETERAEVFSYIKGEYEKLEEIIRAYIATMEGIVSTSRTVPGGIITCIEYGSVTSSYDINENNLRDVDKVRMLHYIMNVVLIPPAVIYRIMMDNFDEYYSIGFDVPTTYSKIHADIFPCNTVTSRSFKIPDDGIFLYKVSMLPLEFPKIVDSSGADVVLPIKDRIDRITCVQSFMENPVYNRAVAMRYWVEKNIMTQFIEES